MEGRDANPLQKFGRINEVARGIDLEVPYEMEFPILELPDRIIFEILARLPFLSVLRCKCVCRAFCGLIRDPYFSKHYISRAPTSYLVREASRKKIHFYEDDSMPSQRMSSSNLSNFKCQVPPKQVVAKLSELHEKMVFVNSCNGFLCMYSGDRPKYYISNPVLDEIMLMPSPPSLEIGHNYLNFSALGFSPNTNKFKVVRFVSKLAKVVAEVLTVGRKSWTSVDCSLAGNPVESLDPFVNGALHWISDRCRTEGMLCSFNLDTDTFMPIALPNNLDTDVLKKITWINTGALGDCLCLCYAFEGVSFDVWVMNDYGVKESWTKNFSIDIQYYCGLEIGIKHRPIWFTREGNMWLNCDSSSLVSYCRTKRSFREMVIGAGTTIEAVPYIPSFISLSTAMN
ncbi:hypothetical protein K2173_009125 [Erythroxylum novogranatense]|uniref:F-box domain-containing protein n=1 Tax=Erythroxylum novogranatense TaxID=1862640 RepID=A0AAV8TCZ1_9ROSI|nr:hypothetical protein K2173_009125 [Erythroxylum novogranatense]